MNQTVVKNLDCLIDVNKDKHHGCSFLGYARFAFCLMPDVNWNVFSHCDFEIYLHLHIYCTIQLLSPQPYNVLDITWIIFSSNSDITCLNTPISSVTRASRHH